MALCTHDCKATCFFHTRAKLYIRTSTGHVCSNGNGTCKTCFSYNLRLFAVLFCVQYIVRNIFLLHHPADELTHLYRSSTHKRRPAFIAVFFYLIYYRFKFFPFGFIHHVFLIFSDGFYISRYRNHIQFINAPKFRCFCLCSTRHARKLVVHAEIILQRHRSICLRRCFNLYILFCFQCLVQAVRITPAFHDTAGLLIYNFHFFFYHHILHVFIK